MSEVETEKAPMAGWKATGILLASAVVGIWAAVHVLPVVAAHLVATAVLGGGAAVAVGYKKDRRDKILSFGSKVKDFYKDVFKGFRAGWNKGVDWAERQEAAAKAAREAQGGTSPLASKEAANDFEAAASGAKVTAKREAPAPAPKKTAGLGM